MLAMPTQYTLTKDILCLQRFTSWLNKVLKKEVD